MFIIESISFLGFEHLVFLINGELVLSFPTSVNGIFNGTRVTVLQGDITDQNTDAIVNAADPKLSGGGGVDGAIHRKGGPRLQQECYDLINSEYPSGIPTGEPIITSGGLLRAHYVIHVVGPIWLAKGDEDLILYNCYVNALSLARQMNIRSVSFPSISTGAYGYPLEKAAPISIRAVMDFVNRHQFFDEIRFVLFDTPTFEAFFRSFSEYR